MSFRLMTTTLCIGLLSATARAQNVDMTGCRPQPGLVAVSEGGSLAVTWDSAGNGAFTQPVRLK
jgi:hypothetical protein